MAFRVAREPASAALDSDLFKLLFEAEILFAKFDFDVEAVFNVPDTDGLALASADLSEDIGGRDKLRQQHTQAKERAHSNSKHSHIYENTLNLELAQVHQ